MLDNFVKIWQKMACIYKIRQTFWIIVGLCLTNVCQAGTYGRITVPTKNEPYCEFMPFWYDGDGEKFSELRHPITVEKPVVITVSSPKYFRTELFGLNPLTGLGIIYKNTMIQPVKLSDKKYQYTLPMIKAGDVYAFVGKLKYPSTGLNICVKEILPK